MIGVGSAHSGLCFPPRNRAQADPIRAGSETGREPHRAAWFPVGG
jgi:hypothetical protein